MGLFEFLAVVVDALDGADVPHMLSGSIASARHGESRATQDVDIVIDPTADQVDDLMGRLARLGWYVGDGRDALSHRSQFNVIDSRSGWKVDFIIRKARPFSHVEFDRRRPATVGGVELCIVTPEDSILSKLDWARESGSERQLRDVASIVRQQRSSLDWGYLEKWGAQLGVSHLLEQVRDGP
jgi:hypothetical protein